MALVRTIDEVAGGAFNGKETVFGEAYRIHNGVLSATFANKD